MNCGTQPTLLSDECCCMMLYVSVKHRSSSRFRAASTMTNVVAWNELAGLTDACDRTIAIENRKQSSVCIIERMKIAFRSALVCTSLRYMALQGNALRAGRDYDQQVVENAKLRNQIVEITRDADAVVSTVYPKRNWRKNESVIQSRGRNLELGKR